MQGTIAFPALSTTERDRSSGRMRELMDQQDLGGMLADHELSRRGHSWPPGRIVRSGNPGHGFVEWEWAGSELAVLGPGDAMGAELFSCCAGFETQQQMYVLPGIAPLRRGVVFSDVREAVQEPIVDEGVRSRAPVLQTGSSELSNSSTWENAQGRPDTPHLRIPPDTPSDGDLEIEADMSFMIQPGAVEGLHQVCVGGTGVVSRGGCNEVNSRARPEHTSSRRSRCPSVSSSRRLAKIRGKHECYSPI